MVSAELQEGRRLPEEGKNTKDEMFRGVEKGLDLCSRKCSRFMHHEMFRETGHAENI